MKINLVLYIKLLIVFFTLPFLAPVVGFGFLKASLMIKYVIATFILFFRKNVGFCFIERLYVLTFSVVLILISYDFFFKVSDVKTFAYYMMILLEFYIIFKLSVLFRNDSSQVINKLVEFIVSIVTCLNLLSFVLIIIGYSGALDTRYNPFGPPTIEYSGIFLTTNYATLFSAIGILFSFYLLTVIGKLKGYYFAFLLNFAALILYHSRTQTLFVIFILLFYFLLNNKKYFIVILMSLLSLAVFFYQNIVGILYQFLRIQNLVERGILGNRGVIMGYVLENMHLIKFTGLGLGNARYIWSMDGAYTGNLSVVDLGNMIGLNMHSALFNYLVELSILGVFVFYLFPLYVYFKSANIKGDSTFVLRIILLFFIIDSIINDDLTTLGSPGVIFYILVMSILYGKIRFSQNVFRFFDNNAVPDKLTS